MACVLWVLCGIYVVQFIDRGWIAHDEGALGQSAERVLRGETPHRDFDEVYTGGLTYLHAVAMKLVGVNLLAPRWMLLVFFMLFLAAVYGIARRVASPSAALVALALATAWSVPNYFVSAPSWYNLFFATFGVLAFLRYLETERRRWLFVAGACGGLSLLIKVIGLYYLAGGVLFLMYLEQTSAPSYGAGQRKRSGFWPVAAIPGVLLILLAVLLSRSAGLGLLQVLAPAFFVCAFLAWREWAEGCGRFAFRAERLIALSWPFVAGAVVPVAAFLLWFWQQHAVAELLRGVFVLPQRRLIEASASPPVVATLGLAVPYALVLLAGRRRAVPRESLLAVVAAGVLAAMLVLANYPRVYQGVWAATRAMPLLAAVAGIWLIGKRQVATGQTDVAPQAQARAWLVVTMAAVVALVQVPYATPIYFCYAAPMTMLAVFAVVFAQPRSLMRVHLAVAAFVFAFAIIFVNRTYGWNLGVKFLPYAPQSRLDIPRGGLLVPDDDHRTYEELVRVIRQHVAGGTIVAGPDCPEVYFLSGFPNPTRALFDFLTPEREDDAWMAGLLARAPIRAAVINTAPLFSPRFSPDVLRLLEARFPSSQQVGQFLVRFE